MSSISHWGMFETEEDDQPISSIHHHVFFGGNMSPSGYWEEKFNQRFPDGKVEVQETPFLAALINLSK